MRPGPTLVLLAVVAAVAATAGYFVGRPATAMAATVGAPTERRILYYQSPMHPWITSPEPGQCTICGMNLAPVYEGDAGFGSGEVVKLSDATAAVIGVATTTAHETDLTRRLRVNGIFEIDHTRHRVLSARVPGRIESLAVDQVGQTVAADAPLAVLYSPAMLTAQRVYLERLIAGPGAFSASQLAEARERLLDLGATEEDIAQLSETRETNPIVTVRAPFSGTVTVRGEKAYPGAYVAEGDTLFQLGDLDTLWFVFDAYESDLDLLRVGQPVTLTTANPGAEPHFAHISFIDPNIDAMTRTARVRVVVNNRSRTFRHRQTATGEVAIDLGRALTVPRSAVLFTREQPVVFVALPDQAYAARPVRLGRANAEAYEIREGLAAGEAVVTRAALLLESQAQLALVPMAAHPMDTMTGHAVVDAHTDIAALEPLVLAAADAAAALGHDDLTAYAANLPAVHAAWDLYVAATPDAAGGPLAERVNALSDGPTLDEAREPFEIFSTTVADLARAAGLHHQGKVVVFQCPMSPVLGTGRWVQRDDDLRNPFFGAAMLTCGERLD